MQAGLQPRRDSYEVRGLACHNIEVEIRGASPEIVLIGAHYDFVFGSPARTITEPASPHYLRWLAALPGKKRIRLCALLRLLMRSRQIFKRRRWEV